ncbi:histidine phosphatase superfamily [Pseudomassariella vexata]|uniref:Histidine phosphatase superfamily n=1 Tax=Pseudomassariella vexata TaxID=1141098 RepID=A0A1Y2DL59_9PEZI|nr:histidine phosphatase superfamily [Pseudomassariella vexata]ORY60020.1 histidine phosphatase superfamily [Pseudomassariella vexata]
MHLLLVRHGESVDNVAGLYAGSRDSPLTNHGVLQAKRLGAHIASHWDAIGPITHVFASNLQRACKTAEAIVEAQLAASSTLASGIEIAREVIQLSELREKDFGSSEGKKFGTRTNGSDSESRDAMMVRVNHFLDDHLLPLLHDCVSKKSTIVIIAHGIILNVLLKALRLRLPTSASSSVVQDGSSNSNVEYVTWSNTGVLQARMEEVETVPERPSLDEKNAPGDEPSAPELPECLPTSDALDSRRFAFVVQSTNNTDHLRGLKKTRGGIGSAKSDSRQRTMDSFFAVTSNKRKATEE